MFCRLKYVLHVLSLTWSFPSCSRSCPRATDASREAQPIRSISLFFLWLQRRSESWLLAFPTLGTGFGPRLPHRDPESSAAPLLLVSEGCRDPGDSSNSGHSSVEERK